MITCREILTNPSLIPSYEVNDIFKPFLFPDIESIVKEIANYQCDNISAELSELIKKEAKQFHLKFETLSKNVSENIESISTGSKLIIIPHQPNYLASLNVILPIFLLEFLGKRLCKKKYTLLYLSIDYDEASETRFNRVKYPDALRLKKQFYLSDNISSSSKYDLMFKIGMPNEKDFFESINTLEELIKENISTLEKLNSTLGLQTSLIIERWEKIKPDILSIFQKSSSLTEFNSGFLSYVVNNIFGYSVCFFSGSKAVQLYKKEILDFSISNINLNQSINDAISVLEKNNIKSTFKKLKNSDSQLWAYCSSCKRRHAISFTNGKFVIENCKSNAYANKLSKNELDTEIYPKVILDNILDSTFYKKIASTGYIGQAEHLFISSYVSNQFGIKVPPHLIIDSSNFTFGYFEYIQFLNFKNGQIDKRTFSDAMKISAKGKYSILYYLINFGAEKMRMQFESFYFTNSINNFNNNQFMNLASEQDLMELNKINFQI